MITIPRPQKQCNTFFSKLFEARDTAHLLHLKNFSFAKHIALNEFYDEILELIDGLVESYQGIYGIQEIEIVSSKVSDPIEYLTDFYNYIETNKLQFRESWIINEIDNISKLTAQTLFKLKNL